MAGINKVIIIGNLGNAPEIRAMQNGDTVANFSVATSESWVDKNTQEKFGSSQKFMMSSEETAKKIIKAMEKERRFSIIGFRNRVSMFLINLLPISLQLRLAGLVLKKVIK